MFNSLPSILIFKDDHVTRNAVALVIFRLLNVIYEMWRNALTRYIVINKSFRKAIGKFEIKLEIRSSGKVFLSSKGCANLRNEPALWRCC